MCVYLDLFKMTYGSLECHGTLFMSIPVPLNLMRYPLVRRLCDHTYVITRPLPHDVTSCGRGAR